MRGSPWVFFHVNGKRAGQRLKSFRGAFKAALDRAGVPHSIRVHDLRHTRATRWIENGTSLRDVQKQLGHTTIVTTELYTDLAGVSASRVIHRRASRVGQHRRLGRSKLSQRQKGKTKPPVGTAPAGGFCVPVGAVSGLKMCQMCQIVCQMPFLGPFST